MVHGEILDRVDMKPATYTELIKSTLMSTVNIQQFFDISHFANIPRSREGIKNRLRINSEKFKGNYFIILLLCLGGFLLRELRALILVGLWMFYFYVCDNFFAVIPEGSTLDINSISIKKEYFLYFCVFVSALFMLLFNGIIIGLVFTLSLFLVLSMAHMLFYREEESVDEL